MRDLRVPGLTTSSAPNPRGWGRAPGGETLSRDCRVAAQVRQAQPSLSRGSRATQGPSILQSQGMLGTRLLDQKWLFFFFFFGATHATTVLSARMLGCFCPPASPAPNSCSPFKAKLTCRLPCEAIRDLSRSNDSVY